MQAPKEEVVVKGDNSLIVFSWLMLFIFITVGIFVLFNFWGSIELLLIVPILVGMKVFESYLIAEIKILNKNLILKRTLKDVIIPLEKIKGVRLITVRDAEIMPNHYVLEILTNFGQSYYYPWRLGRKSKVTIDKFESLLEKKIVRGVPIQETEAFRHGYFLWELVL